MPMTSGLKSVISASLIAIGVLGVTSAHAMDARVVVIAEAESSRGVPRFRLVADDRVIGEAQLGRSLDERSTRQHGSLLREIRVHRSKHRKGEVPRH